MEEAPHSLTKGAACQGLGWRHGEASSGPTADSCPHSHDPTCCPTLQQTSDRAPPCHFTKGLPNRSLRSGRAGAAAHRNPGATSGAARWFRNLHCSLRAASAETRGILAYLARFLTGKAPETQAEPQGHQHPRDTQHPRDAQHPRAAGRAPWLLSQRRLPRSGERPEGSCANGECLARSRYSVNMC